MRGRQQVERLAHESIVWFANNYKLNQHMENDMLVNASKRLVSCHAAQRPNSFLIAAVVIGGMLVANGNTLSAQTPSNVSETEKVSHIEEVAHAPHASDHGKNMPAGMKCPVTGKLSLIHI